MDPMRLTAAAFAALFAFLLLAAPPPSEPDPDPSGPVVIAAQP